MRNIGSSNDCDAVVIFAKLEQLAYPSPMSSQCALMRATHTETLQTRSDRAFLFELVSGGLSRQESRRVAWNSFQFVCDLSVMPEPACDSADPRRVGGFSDQFAHGNLV